MKNFVKVVSLHDLDGQLHPLIIIFEDIKYHITKVTQITAAHSLKNGGSGTRYTCVFENQQMRYLFYDHGLWFIEKIL